ncbi:hypothetical protein ANN_10338 [Periplaneta americana]|uniref:Uncharacterized protein n=1 Tax=Periplaneta americana TaxID=6978 RepID=A0ABQ8TR46_PERAM|nr:hypothetical protein ANN_10338 [Periplaneta americana]
MFDFRVMSHRFPERHGCGKMWTPHSPDINPPTDTGKEMDNESDDSQFSENEILSVLCSALKTGETSVNINEGVLPDNANAKENRPSENGCCRLGIVRPVLPVLERTNVTSLSKLARKGQLDNIGHRVISDNVSFTSDTLQTKQRTGEYGSFAIYVQNFVRTPRVDGSIRPKYANTIGSSYESRPLRKNEIYARVGLLSCEEREKNRMVRDQVSMEGVEELSPVVLQVPLGQGQSDVQGRCHVATANSLYAIRRIESRKLPRISL